MFRHKALKFDAACRANKSGPISPRSNGAVMPIGRRARGCSRLVSLAQGRQLAAFKNNTLRLRIRCLWTENLSSDRADEEHRATLAKVDLINR